MKNLSNFIAFTVSILIIIIAANSTSIIFQNTNKFYKDIFKIYFNKIYLSSQINSYYCDSCKITSIITTTTISVLHALLFKHGLDINIGNASSH